jgi:GT2 family glycosyltransferase
MAQDRPTVAVILVNWNGHAQTRKCLQALNGLDYDGAAEVCVVDNGSSDSSVGNIRRDFPGATVLALGANNGFAAACNAGVRWAKSRGARYAWLLNNDTWVEPGSLAALVDFAEGLPGPAVAAPMILTGDEAARVWSAGGRFRWPWMQAEHLESARYTEETSPYRAAWASGCALFFPVSLFDAVGSMDERYFLYLEDVEWCARARRRGFDVWVVPQARIHHAVSQTVSSIDPRIKRYYGVRNYYMFAWKYCSPAGKAFLAGRFAITSAKIALRCLLYPSYRSDGWYHAQTRALADVARRRSGKAPYPDQQPAVPAHTLDRQAAG